MKIELFMYEKRIIVIRVSRYPKIDHVFEKYTSVIFREILFKPLFYKKFQKKRLFLRKVMDEKRFVALIFSNHVLTVICQQR